MQRVYKISEQDYILGSNAHSKWKYNIIHLGFAIFMAVVTGGFWYANRSCPDPFPSIYRGLFIVAPMLAFLASYFGLQRAWKSLYQKQPAFHGDHFLEIGDESITFRNDRGTSQIPKEKVHSWKETSEFFMIYEHSKRFHYVPKNDFEAAELELLQKFLAG